MGGDERLVYFQFYLHFTLETGIIHRNVIKHTGNVISLSLSMMIAPLLIPCLQFQFTVPVQLEDDGAVHDGETQEANPPQKDTSKHTGMEIQDHHLQSCTAVLVFNRHILHFTRFIFTQKESEMRSKSPARENQSWRQIWPSRAPADKTYQI